MESILALLQRTGGIMHLSWGQAIMLVISLLLLYLAVVKKFEPLLLLPIGFGGLLSNIPEANMAFSALENLLHSNNQHLSASTRIYCIAIPTYRQ